MFIFSWIQLWSQPRCSQVSELLLNWEYPSYVTVCLPYQQQWIIEAEDIKENHPIQKGKTLKEKIVGGKNNFKIIKVLFRISVPFYADLNWKILVWHHTGSRHTGSLTAWYTWPRPEDTLARTSPWMLEVATSSAGRLASACSGSGSYTALVTRLGKSRARDIA